MRQTSFLQFVLRNLGWAALSLALALVIWLAANMANNPIEEREIKDLPIVIRLPEGYVLIRQSEQAADAVVRAPQNDWGLITHEDITVLADLTEINQPGEYRVELEAEIDRRRHARVAALRPGSMTVQIDRQAEARVGVKVIVLAEPPLGYSYPRDLVCDQTEVIVRGSAEKVASVDHVEVRMNLSDERNPITRSFTLIPVKSDGTTVRDIELVPGTVTCAVDIRVSENVFQMRVLPTVTGDPPPGYIFEGYEADPETVGVTGNRSAISALSGVVRTAPVNLANQTQSFSVEAQLDLPTGVSLVPANQVIRVTVTIAPVRSSRQFQEVPVEITGLDQTQFRAIVLPNAVTVLVVGPEALLPTRDDLRVRVDLKGLPPGNHQVTPQGSLAEGAGNDMAISVRPEQISVTIEMLNPTPTLPVTPGPPG